MRISDWSSDVCSSDLVEVLTDDIADHPGDMPLPIRRRLVDLTKHLLSKRLGDHHPFTELELFRVFGEGHHDRELAGGHATLPMKGALANPRCLISVSAFRISEEPTSELQSLIRISYAVFCLKKKNRHT